MKAKIIDLIKKYRAESKRYWAPTTGYGNGYARGNSVAYDYCADDLEELLKEGENVGQNISNTELDRDIRDTLKSIMNFIGADEKWAEYAQLQSWLESLVRRN